MPKQTPNLIRLLIKLIVIIAALLVAYLLYYLILPAGLQVISFVFPLIAPFLLAAVLAAIIEPLVSFFEIRARMNRTLAVATVITLCIGLGAALLIMFISRLIVELAVLTNTLPAHVHNMVTYLWTLYHKMQEIYFAIDIPPQIMVSIEQLLREATGWATNFSSSIFTGLIEFLVSLPGGFIFILFFFLGLFFFSKDAYLIKKSLLHLFPIDWRNSLSNIVGKTSQAIIGFLRAQSILMFITIIQSIIGFYFLDVEYAFTLAVIVGIVDLLPVVGPGLVFLPWAMWLFLTGNMKLGFGLLILWLFVVVVRQILEPKLVGDSVGLHPLEALIAMFVGLKVFGIAGVLYGPILLVVLKATWQAGIFKWPYTQ
ncbi:MAG: sporulation integral membrane protein YtvI [Syntrophomonadaceae bacterium]|nr:sporulation integral membrane protein YtvI [Syntrophomonadaceae bacterium]